MINKELTHTFSLQHSIRQGCPLSMFLYMLVVDALGYLLHKYNQLNLIKGISITHNFVVINSHFVDDSMLFIQNSEIEINNVMGVLNLYCEVSSLKLAHHKTEFLMVQSGSPLCWIHKEWNPRYLGIPFGMGVSISEMWNRYLQKLKNKLCTWGNKFLLFVGKIQVVNRIFLASQVYYSSC